MRPHSASRAERDFKPSPPMRTAFASRAGASLKGRHGCARTASRMKRFALPDEATASRTTRRVSVSSTITVWPGPEFQIWKSLETCTV